MIFGRRKERLIEGGPYELEDRMGDARLFRSVERNEKMLRELFDGDNSMIFRRFGEKREFLLLLVDGMIDNLNVNQSVVLPLEEAQRQGCCPSDIDGIADKVLAVNDVKHVTKVSDMIDSLLYGDTLLIMDGYSSALVLSTKGFVRRGLTSSENEKGAAGPQEAFTEAFMTNLSLIRRKLRTPDLKFSFRKLGTVTRTNVVVCYLRGVTDEGLLEEVERRLATVHLNGILDSNYIAEMICDTPRSPFRTVGSTERPDVVVSKLLEGRIALIVDGSPTVVTLPHLFMEYFQSQNDYYSGYWFSTFTRLLRYLGFIIAISAPALYTAVLNFHPDMLPATMLVTIAQARNGILIPTVAELAFMLVALCILQEAGVRAPPAIGSPLSIVGGLILGQAAVDAKLVSAPVIIVVAVWAVTNMMLPNLRGPVMLCTALLLGLSGALGLYGYSLGVSAIALHVSTMESFGVPYASYIMPYSFRELRDGLIRANWRSMSRGPLFGIRGGEK